MDLCSSLKDDMQCAVGVARWALAGAVALAISVPVAIARYQRNLAGHCLRPIADLGLAVKRKARGGVADPSQPASRELLAEQLRRLLALGHYQMILLPILADHEPGFSRKLLDPAYAEALPLAEGVVEQAAVLAPNFPFRINYVAGLVVQVAADEVGEVALTDEAQAGAVFLAVVVQADLFGVGPHLIFLHVAEWHYAVAEIGDAIEEVGLALVVVRRLVQGDLAGVALVL